VAVSVLEIDPEIGINFSGRPNCEIATQGRPEKLDVKSSPISKTTQERFFGSRVNPNTAVP
jgi:hypothetical protein